MSIRLPVDHVVVLVPDLDAAGAAFEAAGLHVTPKTMHSATMGTANRCVMLDGSYIEIMGIVAETSANATWRKLLSDGAGIRGLALRSNDIEVSARVLAQHATPAAPVRQFSRMTADGELRFSITRIDPAATPGLQCLVCQHHTADLLWLPQTMMHANGAAHLASIALPQAGSLSALPDDEAGASTAIETGSARLTLSGASAQYHDLRASCGIELEIVPV
ncbi:MULTISPECIES: VOC family protein [unclassified Rhizobium]|uniref:VOC family protein n=1 Tax=unclassified Rhizobium TaxID=2613769 RepID=UPI001ADC0BA0|nr:MULTISPECIES: VOC family protein [unclassified Rhizobium]MBO9123924.1 VOC family protein [Rhizobium sp. 16-488-2b]MBO9174456.1 VOC family protein [Rhizobium sp. 16-488-2a]